MTVLDLDSPEHRLCSETMARYKDEIAELRAHIDRLTRERDLEAKIKREAIYQADLEAARAERAEAELKKRDENPATERVTKEEWKKLAEGLLVALQTNESLARVRRKFNLHGLEATLPPLREEDPEDEVLAQRASDWLDKQADAHNIGHYRRNSVVTWLTKLLTKVRDEERAKWTNKD